MGQGGFRLWLGADLGADHDPGRLGGSDHRHHFQIALGRQSLVEPQLIPAGLGPSVGGGKIHKAKGHWLFEFVGVGACEDHPGEVGFDQLQLAHRMGIGLGAQEASHQRWVPRVGDHL